MFMPLMASLLLAAPGTPAARPTAMAHHHEMAKPANRICPVLGNPVTPGKSPVVHVWGHAYYVCCASCKAKLAADPGKYLLKDGTPKNEQHKASATPHAMSNMPGM